MIFTMVNSKGEQVDFTFNGKGSFLQMIGTMYDAVKKDTEDSFWHELSEKTGFETKEDFWKWIQVMGEYDMIDAHINMQERIDDFVSDVLSQTDYDTIYEMIDKIDELKDIIGDIHEQTRGI